MSIYAARARGTTTRLPRDMPNRLLLLNLGRLTSCELVVEAGVAGLQQVRKPPAFDPDAGYITKAEATKMVAACRAMLPAEKAEAE